RPSMQPPVDFSHLGKVGAAKTASGLHALAARQVLLTVPDFMRLLGVGGEKVAAYSEYVSRHLPGIYNRLAADPNLDSQLRANAFNVEGRLPSREQRDFAAKTAS